MAKYTFNLNPAKCVKAYGRALKISTKYSKIVCRKITGMTLEKGKKLLEDLINQKRSLDGKYYTKISKELLSLLKHAENNAEYKGMDVSRMIIHASAHKGFTFRRPRNLKRRGEKMKITNIQIVLMKK